MKISFVPESKRRTVGGSCACGACPSALRRSSMSAACSGVGPEMRVGTLSRVPIAAAQIDDPPRHEARGRSDRKEGAAQPRHGAAESNRQIANDDHGVAHGMPHLGRLERLVNRLDRHGTLADR